jgi:hypothetical protein
MEWAAQAARLALGRIVVLLAAAAQTVQQRMAAELEVLDLADKLIFTAVAALVMPITAVIIRMDEAVELSSEDREERQGPSAQEISVALQEQVQQAIEH